MRTSYEEIWPWQLAGVVALWRALAQSWRKSINLAKTWAALRSWAA